MCTPAVARSALMLSTCAQVTTTQTMLHRPTQCLNCMNCFCPLAELAETERLRVDAHTLQMDVASMQEELSHKDAMLATALAKLEAAEAGRREAVAWANDASK